MIRPGSSSASPSDERKVYDVYDLPVGTSISFRGYAPKIVAQRLGRSPISQIASKRWGKAATAHQAAQPEDNHGF
jgi:hypothetical protein